MTKQGWAANEPDVVAQLRAFASANMALESRLIEAQTAQAIIEHSAHVTRERHAWRAYASHREVCPDCKVPHGPCAIGMRLLANTDRKPLRVERSQEWWLRRVDLESDAVDTKEPKREAK